MQPGWKEGPFASDDPQIFPKNSDIQFLWKYGGLKVLSATSHLVGKTTRSKAAIPSKDDLLDRTVKILGSGWSKEIEPIVLYKSRLYL